MIFYVLEGDVAARFWVLATNLPTVDIVPYRPGPVVE